MTRQGEAAVASIATRFDLSMYTLTAEVDDNSQFLDPVIIGTVTYSNGRVVFSLTPAEVDAVEGKYFRIVGYHNTENTYFYFVKGTIEYTPVTEREILDGLLDPSGNIKLEKLPLEEIRTWLAANP